MQVVPYRTSYMMTKARRIQDPIPQYKESAIKTGWCSGWEDEKYHSSCPYQFHSMSVNTKYTCSCECHTHK
jgi:hypothetical protein